MKKIIFLVLIVISCLVYSCRKELEKPYWDTEVLAPLVKATLNINNILPDSILQSNPDSSMKIVYEGDIYHLDMDSLFKINDTTLFTDYVMPAMQTFSAGQVIVSGINSETTYDLANGVQLRKAIIKSGHMTYTIKSKIHGITEFTYSIPCATKPTGGTFSIDVIVPAAVGSTPGVYSQTFDLSGYTFDLTGIAHNKVNTISTSFSAMVPVAGAAVTVNPNDSLIIENTFSEILPYYGLGYFGSNTFNVGPSTTDFGMFSRITDGTIQLEDVTFNLALTNPIGMDARLYINNLSSINTRTGTSIDLVNSIIGAPTNINRAAESGGIVYPTYANFPLTTSNSNIKPMIENLPDKFGYSMKLITNPLGNISGSNDFVYSDKLMQAKLNMEIPLSLIATNLTLVDTFDIHLSNTAGVENIHSGTLTMVADNGFPFTASIQLYLLDANNHVTDSIYVAANTIDNAVLNTSLRAIGKKETKLVAPMSEAKMKLLYASPKVKMQVKFNTASQSQFVKIYSDYSIDIKLVGDINYTIHLH